MSWHSFFNAWQRIDIEEDVSSLIQSAFTRGPEVARRGSSDFRRRLTASLKAFRTLRTCLLATSAPDSAVQLCNIRLREIEGWGQVDLQAQTWLEETLPEIRALYHHPTPTSASAPSQGLGVRTLDSGRPLPPQPPAITRASNQTSGRQRSRSPRAEPASSSAHNPEGEEDHVVIEDVGPTAPKRVLVSLDWHGVLDKSFADSRVFLDRLRGVPGFEVHICILSYSGTRRGTENKETAARVFPGIPFYRTNRPEDKAWYLEWLTQEFEAERAIHLDDREDICEWVDEYGPEYKSLLVPAHVCLSSLASRVVRWIKRRR